MDAQLENELCSIIKIVFVISVRVNDWTAGLAIIASNSLCRKIVKMTSTYLSNYSFKR